MPTTTPQRRFGPGSALPIAGGVLSAGRRVADHDGWDLPGMGPSRALPPASPAPTAPTGRFARTPAEEETVVDAEVVREG